MCCSTFGIGDLTSPNRGFVARPPPPPPPPPVLEGDSYQHNASNTRSVDVAAASVSACPWPPPPGSLGTLGPPVGVGVGSNDISPAPAVPPPPFLNEATLHSIPISSRPPCSKRQCRRRLEYRPPYPPPPHNLILCVARFAEARSVVTLGATFLNGQMLRYTT